MINAPTNLSSALRHGRGAARALDQRLRPDRYPGWSSDDVPDQRGRTWLITGATNGIGVEIGRAAAAKGARLVLLARRVERGEQLLGSWGAEGRVVSCDLSDLDRVRAAAGEVGEPIDVLINNAGCFAASLHRTPQGHEQMLGTNFLAPFLLTNVLLPLVRDRVVVTGSNAHRSGAFDTADPDFRLRRFNPWTGYAQSKFAETVWALELGRRLSEQGGPLVTLGHPGWAYTNLQRNPSDSVLSAVYRAYDVIGRLGAQSAEAGAWPVLFAATQPLASGSYVGPSAGMRGHPVVQQVAASALDRTTARHVWDWAVEQTNSDAASSGAPA